MLQRRPSIAWSVACLIAGLAPLVGEVEWGRIGVVITACAILSVGIAVGRIEWCLGLPFPATPGFMLWLGHALSFMVGGTLFWLFDVDSSVGLSTDLLAWQMGTLAGGLGAFGCAYAWGVGAWNAAGRAFVEWPSVVMRDAVLIRGCLVIMFVVGAFFLLNPGYRIGAMESLVRRRAHQYLLSLCLALLAFIRPVVLAVLGLYTSGSRKHWPVVILLGIVGLGETFQATLVGGRTTVLQTVLACLTVVLAFRLRRGRIARLCLGAVVCTLLALWYIPTAGEYRSRTAYGGGIQEGELNTPGEHVVAFVEAGATVVVDTSAVRSSVASIVGRLYEPSAFRVMAYARESGVWFGFRGWGDLFFRWLPNFIREKGTDRDQHLMFHQGFKAFEASGETLTVPADLYFRFGLAGVVCGYLILGVIMGLFSWFCRMRFDTVRFVALIALAILVIRLYAIDFVNAVWMPLYELPIGLSVAWLVFSGLGERFRPFHWLVGGGWRGRTASR